MESKHFSLTTNDATALLLPYDSTISSLTVIPSTGISYNPVVEAALLLNTPVKGTTFPNLIGSSSPLEFTALTVFPD